MPGGRKEEANVGRERRYGEHRGPRRPPPLSRRGKGGRPSKGGWRALPRAFMRVDVRPGLTSRGLVGLALCSSARLPTWGCVTMTLLLLYPPAPDRGPKEQCWERNIRPWCLALPHCCLGRARGGVVSKSPACPPACHSSWRCLVRVLEGGLQRGGTWGVGGTAHSTCCVAVAP